MTLFFRTPPMMPRLSPWAMATAALTFLQCTAHHVETRREQALSPHDLAQTQTPHPVKPEAVPVESPKPMPHAVHEKKHEAKGVDAEAVAGLSRPTAIRGALKAGLADGATFQACPPPAYPMASHAPAAAENDESYAPVQENGFLSVAQHPLSTFSIDVDPASYANMRRFLNQGQWPPADAVRTEEWINYFPYSYAQPRGEHPFSITLDMGRTPWNAQSRLVLIGLKARDIETAKLPPQCLTFLIDVSGSMQDANKLPLLKKALGLLIDQMRPQDKVAIAVYAGAAGQVLAPTSGLHKEKIRAALEGLEAGGSTAGAEGLRLAYRLAREGFDREGNNRVLLATDGDFNVGESSDAAMQKLIEDERRGGVYLSVLGFGMGNYKDSKMETLADKGNGNYAYIDNLLEARKVLVEQLGGTLQTLAKDVKLQVEWNPARVSAYRLIGYENRLLRDEDFNDDAKDAGEIGAGHTVTALYEVIPAGVPMPGLPKVDPLKYGMSAVPSNPSGLSDLASKAAAAPAYSDEVLTVKFRYKPPQGETSRLFSEVLKGSDERPLTDASENLRFAAAIAGFAMILRDSPHRGDLTWSHVLTLAEGARRFDPQGYRAECVRLMRLAQSLAPKSLSMGE